MATSPLLAGGAPLDQPAPPATPSGPHGGAQAGPVSELPAAPARPMSRRTALRQTFGALVAGVAAAVVAPSLHAHADPVVAPRTIAYNTTSDPRLSVADIRAAENRGGGQ